MFRKLRFSADEVAYKLTLQAPKRTLQQPTRVVSTDRLWMALGCVRKGKGQINDDTLREKRRLFAAGGGLAFRGGLRMRPDGYAKDGCGASL